MSTTTQVWDTYEKIISETIAEAKFTLEEEDGQDYGEVLKELRRAWELKLIQSGALALGTEVSPNLQTNKLGIKQEEVVHIKQEIKEEPTAETTTEIKAAKKKRTKGDDDVKVKDEHGSGDERPQKRAKSASGSATTAKTTGATGEEDPGHALLVKNGGDQNKNIDFTEEDLDINDDIDEMLGEPLDAKDLILGKVEKKFKSKNKYRFHFRSGIMKIDGLEYVFERGNGDFKW